MPVKIFFCYAHEDELLLKRLKIQLIPLQRQGLIEIWHDRDISAGIEWEREINDQLNTAQIILLLVSPDFIASDYCYGIEMKRALQRHQSGEARVIPVILRPTHWQDILGTIQALPKDAMPVMSASWHSPDDAFFDIAEGVRKVIGEISKKSMFQFSRRNKEIQSVHPFQQEIEKQMAPLDVPADRVVVVAARNALPEYLEHSVYICQPNRSFQRCARLAFYSNGKIDRRVPKIFGQVEAISKEEIETSKDLTNLERERLRNLLHNLDSTRSDEWSQPLKVIFLSPPGSSETLNLPNDVVNNLISSNGRSTAFTQGQRYVSLARLEKGLKTTSELVQGLGNLE